MKRLSAIIIVMMLIVAIPTETFAVSKPSQVKNLKASAKTTSSITLKWNKVKGAKGYEVQQYNSKTKKWKTLKKVKALNYKHTKLKANTSYKYRVRAYKTYKQYYNSKTKKWQNKKPAKKNWKNKKTRTKYVYGKVSKTINVRTNKSKASNNTSNGSTSHTHSWSNWTKVDNTNHKRTCTKDPIHVETKAHSWNNGVITKEPTTTSTGIKTYTCSVCNGTKTETIPKIDESQIDPYSVPLDYWQGMRDDGFTIGTKLTMTNYENKEQIFEKIGKNDWKNRTASGIISLTNSTLMCNNKEVDGEFVAEGGARMLNQSGATFNLSQFGEYGHVQGTITVPGDSSLSANSAMGYYFDVYNLDVSKLQITATDANIETFNTYSCDYNPVPETRYFYNKDGYRIATAFSQNNTYAIRKDRNCSRVIVVFRCEAQTPGNAIGFKLDTINFQIKYDGIIIGNITADPREALGYDKSKIKLGQKDPIRIKCSEIVKRAFPNNSYSWDFAEDAATLQKYIHDNYILDENVLDSNGNYLFCMNCTGGALCMETLAFEIYGEYGFTTPRGGNSLHRAFSLVSNPNDLYPAQGR